MKEQTTAAVVKAIKDEDYEGAIEAVLADLNCTRDEAVDHVDAIEKDMANDHFAEMEAAEDAYWDMRIDEARGK
jgi:hypothetical protein